MPAGKNLKFKMIWENAGVAPPYRNDIITFRLKGPSGSAILKTDSTVRGLMPGKRKTKESVIIPESLKAGTYELSLALLDPRNDEARVRLAIKGREADGWYPLSSIRIE